MRNLTPTSITKAFEKYAKKAPSKTVSAKAAPAKKSGAKKA